MNGDNNSVADTASYQTVLPDNDGEHERSHAENIISLASTGMILKIKKSLNTLNQLMFSGKKAVCRITDKLTK